MIRAYFKMKKSEWLVKAKLYETIAQIWASKDGIIDKLNEVVKKFSEMNADQIKDAMMEQVVKLAASNEK